MLNRYNNNNNRSRRNRNQKRREIVPKNRDIRGRTVALALATVKGVIALPRNYFAPDAILVELVYTDNTLVRNNAGSAYQSWRLRMNSAYDPDPALGTGALPGFTEWAAIYRNYRVLKFDYDWKVSNKDAFPQVVCGAPSQADLGLDYSNLVDFAGQPGGVSGEISALGGMDSETLRGSIDLGEYTGNAVQFLGNDGFGSSTSANPANLLYFNWGNFAGSNLVNGISSRLVCRYTILMYSRGTLLTRKRGKFTTIDLLDE